MQHRAVCVQPGSHLGQDTWAPAHYNTPLLALTVSFKASYSGSSVAGGPYCRAEPSLSLATDQEPQCLLEA